jgi:hypothetical protein
VTDCRATSIPTGLVLPVVALHRLPQDRPRGRELAVLKGALELLRGVRPVVFLATHGDSVREDWLTLSREADYEVAPIGKGGDEWSRRSLPSNSLETSGARPQR